MKTRKIAIYGGGGFAKEVAWLVQSCNEGDKLYEVVCFIDDDKAKQGTEVNGILVIGLEAAHEQFPEARVVGAVGTPKTRQRVMKKAAEIGFGYETIIHPRVEMSSWVKTGPGTVICAGNILTTNIKLGEHVQINLDCTIGHDVVIGDYTTLAPGVHVSGWIHFGQRVYVGTGAVLINGKEHNPIIIGDDAVIGAGACVTESVSSNVIVAGVPAKVIKKPGE
jgi:sugar O-acyltransferase (sialic acid O-acetyltransferase NeuD family)